MQFPKTWMYIKYFSRIDKKPHGWHFCLLAVLNIFESIIHRKSFRIAHMDLKRQFRALRYSNQNDLSNFELPPIELLSVVAGKDIELIPLVVQQAISTSGNEIVRVTIIVPRRDFESAKNVMSELDLTIEHTVINEEELLSLKIQDKLKSIFGARYGWVLQQFLADDYILRSNAAGVLLVNADTVMLRKMDWLTKDSRQILMTSTEYHPPYYLLLNKIMGVPTLPNNTFITHHMLFQPKVLREIFEHFKIFDLENLLNKIELHCDLNDPSPLCVEFEIYAQGIISIHPELVLYRKFANTTWPRTKENLKKVKYTIEKSSLLEWNSISLHDYA